MRKQTQENSDVDAINSLVCQTIEWDGEKKTRGIWRRGTAAHLRPHMCFALVSTDSEPRTGYQRTAPMNRLPFDDHSW